MWRGRSLVVVLPTYNEAASIASCIRDFDALGIVDRIIVVNNNAHPDTSPAVRTTTAHEVFEPVQGYGAAIRRGLVESADADIVCLCEPDGTFAADDLLKLLPYLDDVDVAFGSRTVQMFILRGANMGFFLRWGNWAVAKLVEVLFNTVYLSDVGCTFRVLTRPVIDEILPSLRRDGSAFGLDMMLEVIRRRIPFVQLPVKYRPRVGTSSVTGDPLKTLVLGTQMIATCVRVRLSPTPRRRA